MFFGVWMAALALCVRGEFLKELLLVHCTYAVMDVVAGVLAAVVDAY